MGKIEITRHPEYTTLTLPPELNYYLKNKKLVHEKFFRVFVDVYEGGLFALLISNYFWDKDLNTSKYGKVTKCRIRKREIGLKYSMTRVPNLDKIFIKPNNRKGICSSYRMDYSIIEDGDYFTIVSHCNMSDLYNLPNANSYDFTDTIKDIIGNIYYESAIAHKVKRNSDEFYHFMSKDTDSVTYVTKDKYIDTVANNEDYRDMGRIGRMSLLQKHSRTISIPKLIAKLFPEIDPKIVQQYMEYNKLLSNYDPSLFEVVTGNDIVKYYDNNQYFKSTGDLGSSCMRHSEKTNLIEFYAKNSNVSLIIMKVKNTDSIIARALLWTTTDGTKVMDRIYSSDSRLVSLFHRYADDNKYVNIYTIRTPLSAQRNLNAMSPSNWETNYSTNYIIDLDYIPEALNEANNKTKFLFSFNSRRLSLADSYGFPYIDNFNLVNSVTKQLSLLPIEDTFKCSLSDTYVNKDNYIIYDWLDGVYNKNAVKLDSNNAPVLIEDVVTLEVEPEPEEDIDDEDEDESFIDSEEFEDMNDDPVQTIIAASINTVSRRRQTPQAILDYFNIVPQQQNQDTANV